VRFSDSTGLPLIPDNDPNANPRGLAIRFHLADRVHTDIIAHSTDGFPTRTGQEFLEFLRAAAASDPSKALAIADRGVPRHTSGRPRLRASAQAQPCQLRQGGLFRRDGVPFHQPIWIARYGRYRISPEAGIEHLDEAAGQGQGRDLPVRRA
jgi:catalase